MGLCGLSKKATAIIAGLFTLFQGLFWCIVGILSLLVYSCSINISDRAPHFYRLYLVYLYTGIPMMLEVIATEIEVVTDNGTVVVTWPDDGVEAALHAHSWILVYFICSLGWVVAALLLIIATISEVRGPKGVILRSPWLVLTSVFVILDVITSVLFAIDISYTTNLEDLLEFVGASVDSDTVISSSSTSSTFGYFTTAPSILAVIIFSRILLGWALNLALLVNVAQDARKGESPLPAPGPEPREPYQQYLHKLSTIGPVPDVKWDPYQRKRSELPILKPLKVPSPPNERKRKQSDYQQYMFYAKNPSQPHYLDDIVSEPPTPAVGADPTTTEAWRVTTLQAESQGNLNSFRAGSSVVPIPAPDYEIPGSENGDDSSDRRKL